MLRCCRLRWVADYSIFMVPPPSSPPSSVPCLPSQKRKVTEGHKAQYECVYRPGWRQVSALMTVPIIVSQICPSEIHKIF